MAIGCSSIYAAYWDTSRKCRTYIPNENCVRLKMDCIVNGMNTRQEYMMEKYAIILRNTMDYAIKNEFENKKDSKKLDGFTIYCSNKTME